MPAAYAYDMAYAARWHYNIEHCRIPDPHLVEAEESQRLDHGPGGDALGGGDLAGDLESNLDDLQRVGEHHLRGASLAGEDGVY